MNKYRKEQFISQRYNKKTDKWQFQVRIKDLDVDKTFSESKYGTPRRAFDEAVRYRNECQLNFSKAHKLNRTVTLQEVFDESFDVIPIREETKRKQILYFNKHVDFKNKRMFDVSRSDIVKSLNSMVADCSDDTIKRMFAIWKRIFKTALIREYVQYDLSLGVVPPKSQKIATPHRKVLTDRETLDKMEECIYKSFSETESKSVVMALETMWYTGLRPAECFALSPRDIKGGFIDVNKELGSSLASSGEVLKNNINTIRACKTEASVRRVPIPNALQKLFDEYEVSGNILFPNRYDEYFSVTDLGNRFRRFKIPFTMYQLRHTVATGLIMNTDVDQRSVIEILGHTNVSMSVYYARSNDKEKRNALEKIQYQLNTKNS